MGEEFRGWRKWIAGVGEAAKQDWLSAWPYLALDLGLGRLSGQDFLELFITVDFG